MKIAIASDHAGYKAKEAIKRLLKQLGYNFTDFGTENEDSADYPDFAFKAAEAVSTGEYQRGILICGTGLGMCIAANKVKNIRAAGPHDKFTAEMSRRHNDANVLCLGARILLEPVRDSDPKGRNTITGSYPDGWSGKEDAIKEIVKIWLETPFDTENPRHQRRIQKISDYEA